MASVANNKSIEVLDMERMVAYVERFFVRSRGEWPTVARVARGLGWRQVKVEEKVDDWHAKGPMLTGFNFESMRRGDYFVELVNLPEEVVERVRASVRAS